MPESPEVDALAGALDGEFAGHSVVAVDLIEFRSLKTRGRPLDALVGARLAGVRRFGKHVELVFDRMHLVVSLGRHGWMRVTMSSAPQVDVDAPPTLASLAFDDGRVVEMTDAGDWVSLGLFVVSDPHDVPAVAKLGPDPASSDFSRAYFDAAVRGRRKQIKGILQEQESLAGIGNAYSDEILHAARISPLAHGAALDDDALDRLFAEMLDVVRSATAARRGIPIDRLKEAKVAAMRVHGRAGEPCPVCGDTIREFRFGSASASYCPTCQTAGAVL